MNAALDAIRHSPLTGLFLTLLAYRLAIALNRRCHGHPLTNTVLVGVLLVISVLWGSGMQYQEYMSGARFIHLLLGPATVALAVPLYDNLHHLKRSAPALFFALLFGGVVGILSGAVLGQLFGLPRPILLSILPRSATTPIAMGIAEQVGGIPSVAAACVILTGIVGAAMLGPLRQRFPRLDDLTLGFATGIAAHGVGTARALQLSETAGAFAGLAMGLNGLMTAVLVPLFCSILQL
ncbi:LrgB family protein [Paludibacterium purpuratum]|uniref:Putative murein hydrolase (TIGR00659 family) n=1 Tax=Paludibacterium purpuratum TaxID=1144873 RepID=A0A4R7BC28_9NEIS|nr:LrgB family protein [Paludibacterium purpuratum]TDR81455.1 putative murein hydrolase (TIGR00659 family) [Paludibacterium purpuratum]